MLISVLVGCWLLVLVVGVVGCWCCWLLVLLDWCCWLLVLLVIVLVVGVGDD